jgi:hypothetical protein
MFVQIQPLCLYCAKFHIKAYQKHIKPNYGTLDEIIGFSLLLVGMGKRNGGEYRARTGDLLAASQTL